MTGVTLLTTGSLPHALDQLLSAALTGADRLGEGSLASTPAAAVAQLVVPFTLPVPVIRWESAGFIVSAGKGGPEVTVRVSADGDGKLLELRPSDHYRGGFTPHATVDSGPHRSVIDSPVRSAVISEEACRAHLKRLQRNAEHQLAATARTIERWRPDAIDRVQAAVEARFVVLGLTSALRSALNPAPIELAVPYGDLSLEELVDLAQAREIPADGSMEELRDRLTASDAEL